MGLRISCMQVPYFYITKCRETTMTIATTTNNNIDQHEPAEKVAECQVSDHSSIGSEVSEDLSAWGGTHLVDAHALLSAWDGTPLVDAYASFGLELAKHCRQPKTSDCG